MTEANNLTKNDLTYPSSLPHGLVMHVALATDLIAMLIRRDDDCPNGSSFAVGSNAQPDERVLQLSDASLRRVERYEPPLSLIGRDRAMIAQFAKQLHTFARAHGDYAPIREDPRGNHFDVRLADGLVARVTVTLDRIEEH